MTNPKVLLQVISRIRYIDSDVSLKVYLRIKRKKIRMSMVSFKNMG